MSIQAVEPKDHGLPGEDALYGVVNMLSSFEHLQEDASPEQLQACTWLQAKIESEPHWQALTRIRSRLEELQTKWKSLGGSDGDLANRLHKLSQVASLLGPENAQYYSEIAAMRWGDDHTGSWFDEQPEQPIEQLLLSAVAQRGNLDGDDREWMIEHGADPTSLAPDCRYLKVDVRGSLGITTAGELLRHCQEREESTMVAAHALKAGRCSLVSPNVGPKPVNWATVIIGPNEVSDENPTPSTSECIWTIHPGGPVRFARGGDEDPFQDGEMYDLQDIVDQFGDDFPIKLSES